MMINGLGVNHVCAGRELVHRGEKYAGALVITHTDASKFVGLKKCLRKSWRGHEGWRAVGSWSLIANRRKVVRTHQHQHKGRLYTTV